MESESITQRGSNARLASPKENPEQGRREALVRAIPERYSPVRHLSFTVGTGLAVLALGLAYIEDLRLVELLVVPAMFIVGNATEWWAHKWLLHKRIKPFHILYDQHTPNHHVLYRYDTMGVESYRELHLVLIPPFGVGLITLFVAPIAFVFGFGFGANAGWLVLISASLYVVTYELLHLAYHLPKDHPIGRNRVVSFLREHHRRHHEPRLMNRKNYNVIVPLWDVIMRTRISDEEFAELRGADRNDLEAPASSATARSSVV
ncbi:MAG: sterol desaturase family protein [Myxococcota bacterium]